MSGRKVKAKACSGGKTSCDGRGGGRSFRLPGQNSTSGNWCTTAWCEAVAKTRPPKNRPWYHVPVDENSHTIYVAEQNLEPAENLAPFHHPMVEHFFSRFENGRYFRRDITN